MVLWSIALLELVFASSTCGPAGEVEFQQLTPAELRICRSIVGANGQRVSALDPKCVNFCHLLCSCRTQHQCHWLICLLANSNTMSAVVTQSQQG